MKYCTQWKMAHGFSPRCIHDTVDLCTQSMLSRIKYEHRPPHPYPNYLWENNLCTHKKTKFDYYYNKANENNEAIENYLTAMTFKLNDTKTHKLIQDCILDSFMVHKIMLCNAGIIIIGINICRIWIEWSAWFMVFGE